MSTEKPVWIRGTAESAFSGIDDVTIYESVAREDWDEWSEQERTDFVQSVADMALEQIASCGADIVDESEVPESER